MSNPILDAALAYGGRGWPVLPLHTSDGAGVCSCSKGAACTQAGKHPRTSNGLHGATTDPKVIREWFDRARPPNVGIVTGERSGLYVIDVDVKDGGLERLAELEAKFGPLPRTALVKTGSGGLHFVFKHQTDLVNSQGKAGGFLGVGIDTRGEGGYVVAAPSGHRSGGTYGWVDASGAPVPIPEVAAIPDLVQWVLELQVAHTKQAKAASVKAYRESVKKGTTRANTYERALEAYKRAHRREWPTRKGPCPVPGCPGQSGFGAHPKSEAWVCWNPGHPVGDRDTPGGAGTRQANGHVVGDVADLDAAIAGRTVRDHLIAEGYLAYQMPLLPHSAETAGQKRAEDTTSAREARLGEEPHPAEDDGAEPPPGLEGEVKYRPLTDLGNGERFAQHCARRLRYVPQLDKWFAWTGRVWLPDVSKAVEREAGRVARAIIRDVELVKPIDLGKVGDDQRYNDEVDAIRAWAKQSENDARLAALVRRGGADRAIVALPDDFDRDPLLFNTRSGTIDLRTGAVLQYDQRHLITKLSPAHLASGLDCPRWLRFLEEVSCGDQEWIAYVQRWFGYALTGSVDEHLFVVLHGPTANGKSVLLKILKVLGGGYAITTEASMWEAGTHVNPGAPRPDLMRLRGARIVVVPEMKDHGFNFDQELVKKVVAGDPMAPRGLNQDPVEFRPVAKLLFAMNNRPKVNAQDLAFWRRVRCIPCDLKLSEAEKNKKLEQELLLELPGIMRWALDGALAYQRMGLGTCRRVEQATECWILENDPVERWIRECCNVDKTLQTPTHDLLASFNEWCIDRDVKPLSVTAFGSTLDKKGFAKLRVRIGGANAVSVREGIALK